MVKLDTVTSMAEAPTLDSETSKNKSYAIVWVPDEYTEPQSSTMTIGLERMTVSLVAMQTITYTEEGPNAV